MDTGTEVDVIVLGVGTCGEDVSLQLLYAFPTFHGGIGEAVGAYGRGVGTVLDPEYRGLEVLDAIG